MKYLSTKTCRRSAVDQNLSTNDMITGGLWTDFSSYVDRFRRRSQAYIIEEKNFYGKVIEFVLCFEHNQKIRLQFIFAHANCNPSFILNTFDIDVVQVCYNGTKLISVNFSFFLCKQYINLIIFFCSKMN